MRKKNNPEQLSEMIQAHAQLANDLNSFFDGNVGGKIKTLNNLLNAYLEHEGLKLNYADKNFVPNMVFDLTSVVDFISVCSESWQKFKITHPELIQKLSELD